MSLVKHTAIAAATLAAASPAAASQITVEFTNEASAGGFFFTPVFGAFHDSTANLFDVGSAASPELESIAEDGVNDPALNFFASNHPAAQTFSQPGAAGPIAPGESVSTTVDVDGDINPLFSFASMLVPSQDAFVGLAEALELFDSDGKFNGPLEILFFGEDVYDAGTELNTDNSAIAFLNQIAPDTGATEGGVIGQHAGLNDFILMQMFVGPNGDIAFSEAAADFTQNGFGPVARLTISEVPLPAAVWLFAAGAAGLAGARRRRQSPAS